MRYLIADVFTDTAFGGNPLAVYPDAEGLETAQMQAIAKEMNLSETTFVTPGSAPGHFRVRIFTPANEMVFAGHPTVGTALVLQHLGRTEGREEIVLEEGVGPVRVKLGDGAAIFFMDGPAETHAHAAPNEAFAVALGLRPDRIVGRPWQAGYGTPFTLLQVESREDAATSTLNADLWAKAVGDSWGKRAVYIFATTGYDGATLRLHARMYAPKLGVAEDPATGSAAAALSGSLETEATHLLIDQGVEMGRPSRIAAQIWREDGVVARISIGGGAVVIADNKLLRLP